MLTGARARIGSEIAMRGAQTGARGRSIKYTGSRTDGRRGVDMRGVQTGARGSMALVETGTIGTQGPQCLNEQLRYLE